MAFKSVALALVLVGVGGCAATGTPEVTVAATPRTIRTNGALSSVRVSVLDATGSVAKGSVQVSSDVGSLRDGVVLELDAFGTARVDFSCDQQSDAACTSVASPSVTIEATWGEVTNSVRVTLQAPPPSSEPFCDNGVDDDEDGKADCEDPDCDNVTCNDGQLCTENERCVSGACSGGTQRTCIAPPNSLCASGNGTCDPALGCVYPPRNLGASCSDGNLCTRNDQCDANGRCTGAPVVCDPGTNKCLRDPGTCDKTTGQCKFTNLRDGTRCGDDPGDVCCGGQCRETWNDSYNCGGCGIGCRGAPCYDAAAPDGCGPEPRTSGRCGCQADADCPADHVCMQRRCSPKYGACSPYQSRLTKSEMCAAYCEY